MMLFRLCEQKDMGQIAKLWSYCFEKEDDPFFQYYFTEYCPQQNMVMGGFEVHKDEDELKCMVHLNPYILRLRGEDCFVPYLVGVATAPEARGQHLFRPLLKASIELLRNQGCAFVILMPINAGIYLPYDFAYCYFRHEYKLPLDQLVVAKGQENIYIRKLEVNPYLYEQLEPIYRAATGKQNGVVLRDETQWHKLLRVYQTEDSHCVAAYDEQGQAVGYLIYKLEGETFTVVEMLSTGFQGKNRLMQFIQQQGSCKELHYLADDDDKSYLRFRDQQYAGAVFPFMMARCIDIIEALEMYAENHAFWGAGNSHCRIKFTDSVVEDNNCTLELSLESGRLWVGQVQQEADLVMSVGSFTQLYFGAFSSRELAEAGFIQFIREEQLEFLDVLFPKEKTWINEYF